MPTFTHEQHSLMKEKLSQAIKDFSYRFKRYDINYSIAVGHTTEGTDLNQISNFIRSTDRFIVLNHNTCAVILDCSDELRGTKAANNLLTNLQGNFFSKPLYLTIVTASNYESDSKMIQELFYLLDYAIKHNMNHILLEHYQVIQK
ncbi:MAG: hypothetical protein Q8N01_01815 [Sulfuricurvum sp.]|nr:hypothetical protein [Sulfuricurvum sp.]MDP3022812.1 hypothetical protein [Sulfuricurvum sp.]MDP3119143.1 hypothetical protein [Sulfuricurvum sp.]